MGNIIGRGQTVCPLSGGCPLFRVSIIRGSTVVSKGKPTMMCFPVLTMVAPMN